MNEKEYKWCRINPEKIDELQEIFEGIPRLIFENNTLNEPGTMYFYPHQFKVSIFAKFMAIIFEDEPWAEELTVKDFIKHVKKVA